MNYQINSSKQLKLEHAQRAANKTFNKFSIFEARPHADTHHHSFFEILYIVKGSVYHTTNNNEPQLMQEGDFIFIDIGTIHEYIGDNASLMNIIFTPQVFGDNFTQYSSFADIFKNQKSHLVPISAFFPTDTILHDSDGIILNMIKFLKSKSDNPKGLTDTIIRYGLLSLVLHITEPQYNQKKNMNNITEYLLKLINDHYAEQNLMTRASDELHYTIPHMSSTFKKDLGISFKEYLQFFRISKAKTLLITSKMSISDICSSVGYSNALFFRNTFKKITNMTPSQYRKTPSADHLYD